MLDNHHFFLHVYWYCMFLTMLALRLYGDPSLLSRLKYFNNYSMVSHEILYKHSCPPVDESLWLWWSHSLSSCTNMRLTYLVFSEISWLLKGTASKFGPDILGDQRMNWNHMVKMSGCSVFLKLMTVPSASAGEFSAN